MSDTQQRIDELVKSNEVVLFMKGNASFPMCGFSGRAIQILKAVGVDTRTLKTVNVLDDAEVRQGIKEYSNWPTIPQLYVKGEFVGGSDILMEMYESGELQQMLNGSRAGACTGDEPRPRGSRPRRAGVEARRRACGPRQPARHEHRPDARHEPGRRDQF